MADVFSISKGGTVNWASGGDDIRVLLVGPGYTFDADHDYVNDVVAEEVAGSGYARKRVLNRTTTQVVASDKLQHDADDTVWTAINAGSVTAAIYFVQNASDSLAQLVSFNDLSSEVFTNGGQLTIQVDADGVYEGLPG